MVYQLEKSDEFDYIKYKFGDLVKICDGDRTTAHILSQSIDWHNYKKGGHFYNSDREFAGKVDLDTRTFQRHKKKLKGKNILFVELKMVHGRPLSHHRINAGLVKKLIAENRKPISENSVKKVLEKHQMISSNTNDTDVVAPTTRMSYDQRHGCRMTNDMDVVNTLSYNTSDITSSSPPTPSEAHPVPIQDEKKEEGSNNIYYGKSEQPGSGVAPHHQPKVEAQPVTANDTAIKPSDMKTKTDRMLQIWSRLCPAGKAEVNSHLSFALLGRFKDSFNESFEEWEAYCKKIASSKLLMGERPMEMGKHKGKLFELYLSWALSPANIEKVRHGKYDKDRQVPLTPNQLEARKQEIELQQREEILDKIGNSNQDDWVKKFYVKVLAAFGAKGYYKISDSGGASISQEDGHVEILTQTLEAKEFIEGRRGEIATFLLSLGMNPKFFVKTVCDLRHEKLMALSVEGKSPRKLGLKTFSAILEELQVNEPKRKFANRA